jgi:integrase
MYRVNHEGMKEEERKDGRSGTNALTVDAGGRYLTPWELKMQARTERLLLTWGRYESIKRFMRKISKVSTRFCYLLMLDQYFRWLRDAKGVTMDPDELVKDNLECVYNSAPTDVKTKRRHTDWLDEYVNDYLLNRGVGTKRASAAAAVKVFYRRNDSQLVGDFSVAEGPAVTPDRALLADDVRVVLKTLPLSSRIPFLMEWQSGVEINRVLSLRWGQVAKLWEGEYPLKLEFTGRKRHRKQYHTYLGRDSTEHLKAWHGEWVRLYGRDPRPDDMIFPGKQGTGVSYQYLNGRLRVAAMNLAAKGMVKNWNPSSWHSHMLRHSFKTEGEHAKVDSSFIEYMMGHEQGIAKVYDNRSEIYEGDLVEAYKKMEPALSLDYNEAVASRQGEETSKEMLKLIIDLQRQVAEMKKGQQASSGAQGPARA